MTAVRAPANQNLTAEVIVSGTAYLIDMRRREVRKA
jgi:hypothetical protein